MVPHLDAGGATLGHGPFHVLAQGITTASAGAPGRGTFTVSATFAPPSADLFGSVEVFSVSPKDGSVDEIVRVPVVITR